MSDLISRSKVIELLHTYHIDNVSVNGKRITELVKELPTVEPVHGEWIPCSERLPKPINGEMSVEVEVTIQGFERNITGRAFYFFGLGKFFPPSLGTQPLKNVIAWQPLPEPYMRKKVEE